ncbi:MAG: GGDEF domain-containing protein [Proteobacteria bacterium]|nr:GGDEF domain-containing protein [Pseudomonadota bacterium]
MSDELYTADLEVRLRSAEAAFLLKLFRDHRTAGKQITVGMLDRDVMRAYGKNLIVMEQGEDEEFLFLFAGAEVPDDSGMPLAQKTTRNISQVTADMFRQGALEALSTLDAVFIDHATGQFAAVHRWECLFLPMDPGEGGRMVIALCIPREHKHEYMRHLLNALPCGLFRAAPTRDEHGEIVDATIRAANERAAELSGHADKEDLVGTSLRQVFGDTSSGSGWDRHLTALRTGKQQQFDYHHLGDNGSRWYQVHSVPVRDGILILMIDITEMKRTMLEAEHQKKMLLDEMEQRRALEQELWSLAHLDPLTGLPNRRAFRDSAVLKLAEAQTAHRPCAIISIDIDHFKRVNDAYGHAAGDTVLRRVVDIIKAPLRAHLDIAARMGGEEFVVLLPDTDANAAMAFAEKLRRRVEQTAVIVGEHEIRPTISLGVALNRRSSDLDDLIDRADRALYTAKRTGRNKVAIEATGGVENSDGDATAAA